MSVFSLRGGITRHSDYPEAWERVSSDFWVVPSRNVLSRMMNSRLFFVLLQGYVSTVTAVLCCIMFLFSALICFIMPFLFLKSRCLLWGRNWVVIVIVIVVFVFYFFFSRIMPLAVSDFTIPISFLNVPHLFYFWNYIRNQYLQSQ